MYIHRANIPETEIKEEKDLGVSELQISTTERAEKDTESRETLISGLRYSRVQVCWVCEGSSSNVFTIEPCECTSSLGAVHASCLIDWMNTNSKGRCPRCAAMISVRTEQKPPKMWELDPVFKQNIGKYIVLVTLNLIVTLACLGSAGYLLHTEKAGVAAVIGVVYVLYMFWQSRFYVRIYERLKIYNNKVVQVYEGKLGDVVKRHNLSSYIDRSEL